MFKIRIQQIVHIIRSGSGITLIARSSFNSCAASWDKRAKRVQNADNGGNERHASGAWFRDKRARQQRNC